MLQVETTAWSTADLFASQTKCFENIAGWFEFWSGKVKQIFPTAEVYSAEIHTLSCCRWVCGHKIQSIATVLWTHHWYFARERERKRDVNVNLGRLVICRLWFILIYCYSANAMTVVGMKIFSCVQLARNRALFIVGMKITKVFASLTLSLNSRI